MLTELHWYKFPTMINKITPCVDWINDWKIWTLQFEISVDWINNWKIWTLQFWNQPIKIRQKYPNSRLYMIDYQCDLQSNVPPLAVIIETEFNLNYNEITTAF